MYRFFVEPAAIKEQYIEITGNDVNHIRNVLRMKPGEEILVSDGQGRDFSCVIQQIEADRVTARIADVEGEKRELSARLYLFQALPKGDKMELIIQKAVELGACEIIPVETKRCVVKLDAKKAQSKTARWNSIAESAAKQSKRQIIPRVHSVLGWKEALEYAAGLDLCFIPYEEAADMRRTKELFAQVQAGMSVGIMIGPEGGFCESEIEAAEEAGIYPVTLGRRILRTETAGMMVLSVLMYQLEI